MTQVTFDSVASGDALPSLTIPPISRTTLALFAGASGDHNPIHIDLDAARLAGKEDVFAHGMLSMAYLGRLLTNWVPQQSIREFSTRFSAITWPKEGLICTGVIIEKAEKNGEKLVRLEITVANDNGEVKLSGQALIALP